MQGAPRAVLLLGCGGQGLHQQDNDKPTRLFSLCSRVTLTMSFSQATVRGRVKQRMHWRGRDTFLSTGQRRKCKIRLCTLKQQAHYHIRCCSLIYFTVVQTYTKKHKKTLWHATNGIHIFPPMPPTTPVQLWRRTKNLWCPLPAHSFLLRCFCLSMVAF